MGVTGALMGVGLASSLISANQQAQAKEAEGIYNASIAETNSKLADLSAAETIEQGNILGSRKNMEARQKTGEVRARSAAGGVDVNVGSAKVGQVVQREIGALDELEIRNNARRTAWGYKVESAMDTYKAKFAEMTGKNAADQTLLAGGLGGAYGALNILSRGISGGSTGGSPFGSGSSGGTSVGSYEGVA